MTGDVDPREEQEAAALAAALSGGSPRGAPPDALEAAALVRHGGAELSEARSQAILDDLLASVRPRRRQARWLWWLAPIAATVAVVLALPGVPEPTPLPSPGLALLEAQGAALRAADQASLQAGMGAYRRDVHAALRGRYGGTR